VNGQRVEAFLYKNAEECPICFMFYPPHINKTRCCDQPICSECFVQIKRPDPHQPEHHGEPENPPPEPQEETQLVSEPAACPFCVQPEFGVSYEPPPFRRGLAFNHQGQPPLGSATSAMSSTSSLNSPGVTSPTRRRATSLAVTDKTVITTDMVRPDWAKKLADARAHALRRAVAATALHNAAYMMGGMQQHESRFALGRRRRTMFGTDSAGSSGQGTPRRDREITGEPSADLYPGRGSSRRGNRLDDLEDLMMMEAIRLSLAAEDDRKKREEKDAAKEAKKDHKKKAKELKKVAKAQSRVPSGFHPLDVDTDNDTAAGSSSAAGKGKEVDRTGGAAGFNPMTEPTSTINTTALQDDPQKHLEHSRAQMERERSSSGNLAPVDPFDEPSSHRSALRNLSNASSSASSFAESCQNSLRQGDQNHLAPGSSTGPSPNGSGISLDQAETSTCTEPMFNFSSLTEAITPEDNEKDGGPQYIENVAGTNAPSTKSTSNGLHPSSAMHGNLPAQTHALEESTPTSKPEQQKPSPTSELFDEIEPAPRVEAVANDRSHFDQKRLGDVNMMKEVHHQATQ
jgi:hypothetical protein